MKKFAFTILLALCCYLFSNAQDLRSTLHFGPKVGLNISNVYDTEGENFDTDAKIGLVVGVFASIPINNLLGVQPELHFSQKGFKASGSFLGSEYSFTRTLNYIDIPLLVAVKPSEIFTFLAGPQYSYLISSKDVFDTSFLNFELEQEFENDNLRKNTLCLLGGVDVNLKSIVIGTRVGWDLFKNKDDGSSTTPRYKNVWFQATVGYRF